VQQGLRTLGLDSEIQTGGGGGNQHCAYRLTGCWSGSESKRGTVSREVEALGSPW
jgi:hypothetical protein